MGPFGGDLREAGALLELQVFDLVVIFVRTLVDLEAAPLVVDHVGLLVENGDTDVHIFSCNGGILVSL